MHEQTDEISDHTPVPFPDFIYRYCFAELRRSSLFACRIKIFLFQPSQIFFRFLSFCVSRRPKLPKLDGWLVTETVARTPASASHDPAARLRPAKRRRSAGSRPAGDDTGRVRDTVGSSAALRTRQKSAKTEDEEIYIYIHNILSRVVRGHSPGRHQGRSRPYKTTVQIVCTAV